MALTLADIRTQTLDLVGDPRNETYSAAKCLEAANWACTRAVIELGVAYKEASATTDAGSQFALAAGGQVPLRVMVTSTGKLLDKSNLTYLDFKYSGWRSTTGAAEAWAMFDGRKIQVIPKQASLGLTVGYLEDAVPMTTDGTSPDTRIPDVHHTALKFAAAAWLKGFDGDQKDDGEGALHYQRFLALLGVAKGKSNA